MGVGRVRCKYTRNDSKNNPKLSYNSAATPCNAAELKIILCKRLIVQFKVRAARQNDSKINQIHAESIQKKFKICPKSIKI